MVIGDIATWVGREHEGKEEIAECYGDGALWATGSGSPWLLPFRSHYMIVNAQFYHLNCDMLYLQHKILG